MHQKQNFGATALYSKCNFGNALMGTISVFLPVDGKEYDVAVHLGRKKEIVKRKIIGGVENTIEI